MKIEVNSTTQESVKNDLEVLTNQLYITQGSNITRKSIQNELHMIRKRLFKLVDILEKRGHTKGVVNVLVFDDVGTKTCSLFNDKLFEYLKGNVKVIITTINSTLYLTTQTQIGGFSDAETIQFFQQNYPDCRESIDNILKLGHKFSNLPLGLAIAKKLIRKRKQTIQMYLKQLESRMYQRLLDKESEMLSDGEYEQGLISALIMNIQDIENEVDEQVFKAYELTTFVSSRRFSLDHLKLVLNGSEEEKEFLIGDLIEKITESSLGTIFSDGHDKYMHRLLNTHEAVQLAIRIGWQSDKLKWNLGKCLVFLSQICNKDTRYEKAFMLQLTLLPHTEATQQHADRLSATHDFTLDTLRIQVAEIRLLETLGHMYSELSMIQKAGNFLQNARNEFLKNFLESDVKNKVILALNETSINQEELRFLAEELISELTRYAMKHDKMDFLDLVLKRVYTEEDMTMWCELLADKQVITQEDMNEKQLTKSLTSQFEFEALLKADIALQTEAMQKVLLPELFITILYSYGKLFCYSTSIGTHMPLAKENLFKSHLTLCHEMCKVIYETLGVSILHLVLSDHFGLVLHLMEEHNKSEECIIQDLTEAKEKYEALLEKKDRFFQWGLLKKDVQDTFNQAVALRQLLRILTRLITYQTGGDITALIERVTPLVMH